MTVTSNSYLTMYDLMQCVTTAQGSWDVTESDANATFKKLTISNASQNYDVFDTVRFLQYPNIFDTVKVTTQLQNRNCDGMSLVEQNDGKRALVLVELKSTYSENNLLKAYQQLIFSLLKATQLLYLCDDFSLSTYIPIIIIGCHGVASEEKMVELKDFANKEYQTMKAGKNTFFGKCLPSLLSTGTCTFRLGDLPFLDNLPLNKNLKCRNVRVVLAAGTDAISSSSTYNLTI